MRGTRIACVLVALAVASPLRAQDAVEWFQKAVYTTNPDEQIHYYQKALEVDPGYHQAQHNLAAVYYRKGLLRKAIAQYETLIRGSHAYYQTFYDLACCYARVGDQQHALKALTRAFQKGFHDRKLVARDEDLAAVRERPEFRHLAARYLGGRAPANTPKEDLLPIEPQPVHVAKKTVKRAKPAALAKAAKPAKPTKLKTAHAVKGPLVAKAALLAPAQTAAPAARVAPVEATSTQGDPIAQAQAQMAARAQAAPRANGDAALDAVQGDVAIGK